MRARLSANLPSEAGRDDYVPVRLEAGPGVSRVDPDVGRHLEVITEIRVGRSLAVRLRFYGNVAGGIDR